MFPKSLTKIKSYVESSSDEENLGFSFIRLLVNLCSYLYLLPNKLKLSLKIQFGGVIFRIVKSGRELQESLLDT